MRRSRAWNTLSGTLFTLNKENEQVKVDGPSYCAHDTPNQAPSLAPVGSGTALQKTWPGSVVCLDSVGRMGFLNHGFVSGFLALALHSPTPSRRSKLSFRVSVPSCTGGGRHCGSASSKPVTTPFLFAFFSWKMKAKILGLPTSPAAQVLTG